MEETPGILNTIGLWKSKLDSVITLTIITLFNYLKYSLGNVPLYHLLNNNGVFYILELFDVFS